MAIARVLRDGGTELAESWHARRVEAGQETRLTGSRARAIVAVLADALSVEPDREAERLARGLASMGEFDPDLLLAVEDLASLRTVLHTAVVGALPAEEAVDALGRIHPLLDALMAHMARRERGELEAAAFVDALTGVGNRRALERDATRAFAAARRHQRSLAVAAIDLDGLKAINDRDGHAAGDEALRRLALTLATHLRATDGVYRVGGDEFVLLLPETDPELVRSLLERTATTAPRFSAGVAEFGDDGMTLEAVLARADERLLAGKRRGRTAAGSRTG